MTLDSQPLVSVIVPVHNGVRYLGAALESVRAQNYGNLQIIVIDDGSTDETARVATQFDDIEYSYQVQNGAASARNNGVQQARGKYLAFLDADDLWMGDKLHLQLQALQNGGSNIVLGYVEQFLSPEIDARETTAHVPEETLPAFLPSAMILRRADFLRVGFFETSWQIGEFIDWFARATELGLTHQVLPQVVLHRRVHATNQGVTKRQFHLDYVRIVKASLDRRRQQSIVQPTSSTQMTGEEVTL